MLKFALIRLVVCCLLVLPAWCQESPEKTVSQLYGWLKKVDIQAQKRLPEIQGFLTPELYDQLTRAYQRDPSTGEFLDFDPWSNSQMGASGYSWGPARMVGGQAKVPITVNIYRGGTTKYTCVLSPSASGWRVANLVYTPEFNLLNTLKQINAAP